MSFYVTEKDNYVMPPLYRGSITSDVMKRKEQNRIDAEKRKQELKKKYNIASKK